MNSKRINGNLGRDLLVLEDESNPDTSKAKVIYPSTTLDQVFDDESPTKKTLRQLLEEIHQDIITGGKGNIVFPVTSVNNKNGDIVIDKNSVGLNKVDNTSDIDKPLSVPQQRAIMEILKNYDFNVDIEKICHHILNDHLDEITNEIIKDAWGDEIPSIKDDGSESDTGSPSIFYSNLKTMINTMISQYSYSTTVSTHPDIRRSLSTLWCQVDNFINGFEDRINKVLETMNEHESNSLAHQNIFMSKEDNSNKVSSFSSLSNNDYMKYPSTRAVIDFVTNSINEYNDKHPDVSNWIDDIGVVDTRDDLPNPNSKSYRKAYHIRNGEGSHDEIAICRMNPDNKTYSWDITQLGTYSKFNSDQFIDTTNGLSLKMSSIVDGILSENGALDTSLSKILSNYYTKDHIDNIDKSSIKSIKILTGTKDGTIRFYINDDLTTMSDDISVAGLGRVAYLEWITEDQIFDQAIHENHIISDAVATRHIQDKAVTADKIACKYGYMIGNTSSSDDNVANEISLVELANYLRPLIGGWPDPTVPGENPYFNPFETNVYLWKPGVEYTLNDYSYGMRFTGTISAFSHAEYKIELSNMIRSRECKLVDIGGTWVYQTDPESWGSLGSININDKTYATVTMNSDGVFFESISSADRIDAKYDLWIKYCKNDELNEVLSNNENTEK